MKKATPTLTSQEWRTIYTIRVRAKQGQQLVRSETDLCKRAIREDLDRYRSIGADAFDATVPLGSTAKAKR